MTNINEMDTQIALMLALEAEAELEEKKSSTQRSRATPNNMLVPPERRVSKLIYTDPATQVYLRFLDADECMAMFYYLKDNIPWGESTITRYGGRTRLGCSYQSGRDKIIDNFIKKIDATKPPGQYSLVGVYLNYQRDGEEYTPRHNHEGGFQQLICLGPAKRKFVIGKLSQILGNGDVAIFGSAKHGLPKDTKCREERISIATFYLAVS
jgi:hypothetical protein